MASVLRLAKSDEMDPVREGFAALQPWLASCEDPTRKRRYLHLYQDGSYSEVLPGPLPGRLWTLGQKLHAELLAAGRLEPGDRLSHFGYLIAECGAPAQDWHVDYDGEQLTLYLPLTRETENNATQYFLPAAGYGQAVQFLSDEDDAVPIICSGRQSSHRGVANGEDYRRVVFYFIYAQPGWDSEEPLFDTADRLGVTVDADEYLSSESAKA